MKADEDKSKASPTGINGENSQKLGEVLAKALRQVQVSDCLSAGELALLVESKTTGKAENSKLTAGEADRMMAHLASCDNCYETYLLLSQLKKKEMKLASRSRKFFAHPLRLAASIIIAVFSLFLFYKIAFIPGALKQADELRRPDMVSESVMEYEPAEPSLDAPAPAEKPLKEEVEKTTAGRKKNPASPAKGMSYSDSADKKSSDADAATTTGAVGKLSATDEAALGKTRAKASSAPGAGEQPEQVGLEAQEQDQLIQPAAARPDKKQEAHLATAIQEEKMLRNEEKARGNEMLQEKDAAGKENKVQRQAEPKRAILADTRKKKSGPWEQTARSRDGDKSDTNNWVLLDQLNRKLSIIKYMPDEEVERYLSTTLQLCQRLEVFFQKLKRKSSLAGDSSRIGYYLERGKPAILVVIDRDDVPIRVFPDMKYFLKKTRPSTPAWKFFTLALNGWCDGRGCFGINQDKNLAAVSGDKKKKEKLQKDWQELRPQLSGVLREIAAYTIVRLKKIVSPK